MTRLTFSLAILCIVLACGLPTPTPTPTATYTPIPTDTKTPTPTATPKFVLVPVEALTNQIAEEHGLGFTYVKYPYVPADSEVWILYGWPERGERIYRAVFRLVGGEWTLTETRPMETPTPTATPWDGTEEAMR